jgi:hypothetical protein
VHWWDFTDLSTMWKDAGSTPVAIAGDQVHQIDDKGSRNISLVQATADNQPTMAAPGVAGGPALYANFNGNDHYDPTLAAGLTGAKTYIVVYAGDVGRANLNSWGIWEGLTVLGARESSSRFQSWLDGGRFGVDSITDATWGTWLSTSNGTDSQTTIANFETPDVTSANAATDVQASQQFILGASGTAGQNGWQGPIAHVIIYNVAFSATDLANYKTWFTNEFGQAWA